MNYGEKELYEKQGIIDKLYRGIRKVKMNITKILLQNEQPKDKTKSNYIYDKYDYSYYTDNKQYLYIPIKEK